jgi:hypothetical protein
MGSVPRNRALLVIALVILLGGAGLATGAALTYSDQHSGTPGQAKIGDCSGHYGRYDTGVRCTGTWVTGGSLTAGGKVVIGSVTGADRDDTGKTLDVRIHGSDHATVPDTRTTIILAALGVPMILFGLYMVRVWWRGDGVVTPRG